ncbi:MULTISPECIES: pyridoxal-phosphate dependent enzyme [Halolamina]|uniref:Threonine synthase n=1 Tax=Halolamina pelagica TaxID=699431 RepID=A0A1I5SGB2_9EURY|nr:MULTISPECIES: pyridoxal-phosphate dependent enzyme [Halolamina]NHX37073.1 pyridoxal-phosphate dependent enzyme [Halolamina sp. R1-12]SFP69750.1 threonine synthase [Halolamina pelagica]
MTDPTPLVCPDCGAEYADRWRCTCGHPLEFARQPLPDGPAPDPAAFDAREGLWAFSAFLPVEKRVSLGEGMTPLQHAPDWDAEFKLEYVFPTGSFKDRGATTTLSRALELGVEKVVEDSSGNAGAAVATYAARAGIDAEIYVPASVKQSKIRAIEAAGATPVRIEGSRQDVTDACIDAAVGEGADEGATGDGRPGAGAWYASHAWNPAFFAGTATFAYETALQRNWAAPDAVVTPLGHGTLFLGAYRGFRALKEAGWIDEVPRMYGAQAAGYAPIAAELHGDTAGANDVADGIQIRDPVQKDAILNAIEATGGDAIALTEAPVADELDRLHAAGFYTEPTCAVAPAALDEYRERGAVDADEDVVVPLTGSGLKA